jgi:hypothetical protein
MPDSAVAGLKIGIFITPKLEAFSRRKKSLHETIHELV